MKQKDKNMLYLDEDDNVLEQTAPIQFKFDDYSKESARRIIAGLKKEYFEKKRKEVEEIPVPDIGRYMKRAVIPVLPEELVAVDLAGSKVFVEREELAEILEKLPNRQGQIINLVFFSQESPKRAAEKLNMEKKTLKKSKAKALKRIRKELEKKGYEK